MKIKSNKIYIVSSKTPEGKNYKIGITNDMEKRLRSIKTGNQFKVQIEYLEEIDESVNVLEMENWIHSTFGLVRLEGEWFGDLTQKQIRRKIYQYLLK